MTAISDEPYLLSVEDLVVRYGLRRPMTRWKEPRGDRTVHAVEGVSFSLRRGEMLALVGESGCGKTSTALAVARMVDASRGTIRVHGRDVTALSQRDLRSLRRTVQMIYQDPYESLDPRFRVREIVEEPLIVHGIGGSRQERAAHVADALERVGLSPASLYVGRYPHELSGGQRQRVAIAASLVLSPDLLVADEPVSMLDVSVRAGVLTLLQELRREDRIGVLMITHDLSTAAQFADRIAVMYLGRIVEIASAAEIVDAPKHPYTRALLAAVPRPDPLDVARPEILKGETPDPVHIPPGCRFRPRCPVAEEECKHVDPDLRSPERETTSHLVACILEWDRPDRPAAGSDSVNGSAKKGSLGSSLNAPEATASEITSGDGVPG